MLYEEYEYKTKKRKQNKVGENLIAKMGTVRDQRDAQKKVTKKSTPSSLSPNFASSN